MQSKSNNLDFYPIFDQLPGCWGCKNLQSKFLYINQEYAQLLGINEAQRKHILGKSDLDMPGATKDYAEEARKQDEMVFSTQKSIKVLNIHPFGNNEWKIYVFNKTPFFNNAGDVKGIIFHGVEFTKLLPFDLGNLIFTHCFNGKPISLFEIKPVLINRYKKITLSTREKECLFFILRGGTAKLIARYLNVSHRTIEEYITSLKKKFHSKNKSELIFALMKAGYFNFIPPSLFQQQLSIIIE